MAQQDEHPSLKVKFAAIAKAMEDNEEKIINELNEMQGSPVDINGYYYPDSARTYAAMRPSETLNKIIESITV